MASGSRIVVVVAGDAKSLQTAMRQAETAVRGFEDKADKSGARMAASMRKHAALMGAALLAGLVTGIGTSINAANDLNESINAVGVVFEGAQNKIHTFAENAARDMGLSRRAVNDAVIPIGNLLKNAGMDVDAVADHVIDLTQRAVDLGSTLNVDASEALEKFRAGLAGESEPLKAYGIDVSEAALKTEALALGLTNSTGPLDRVVKAQAALSIIMKESNGFAGDFAKTLEGSLSNQLKIARANAENMAARLGQRLLPATLEVTTAFAEMTAEGGFLSDALGGIGEMIGNVADTAASAISEMGVYWHWLKRITEAAGDGRINNQELAASHGDLTDVRRDSDEQSAEFLATERALIDAEIEHERVMETVGEMYDEMRSGVDRTTTAVETLADRTKRLQTAEQELTDQRLEALNTELAKLRADQRAAEALATLVELQQSGTATAEELRIAELELAIAVEEANVATAKQNAELDRMNGKRIDVTIAQNWITTGAVGQVSSGGLFSIKKLAGGGHLDRGEPAIVGEGGRAELFVPDEAGTVVPMGSRRGAGGGGGGGGAPTYVTIKVEAGISDPQAVATKVVEALQTYYRNNGAIPVAVRG